MQWPVKSPRVVLVQHGFLGGGGTVQLDPL
jgi:hypothetical protein